MWCCDCIHCPVANSCMIVHGLQHTRLLCPPQSPRVYSNSCPWKWWLCLTISSSVTPFSFCLKSFPASESLPKSQLFTLGGQSTGASASASALSINIQGWFLLELTGLNSLQYKTLSGVFCITTFLKHQSLGTEPSLWTNAHMCTWLLEKLYLFFFFLWAYVASVL